MARGGFHVSTVIALAVVLLGQSPSTVEARTAVAILQDGSATSIGVKAELLAGRVAVKEMQEQPGRATKTVTTYSSYGSEVGKAGAGVVVGLFFVVIAFPVLWFNERRQAKMWRLFGRAADIAVPNVSPDKVNDSNDARLVHIVGETSTDDVLNDEDLGLTVKGAAKLQREVSMYQWLEKSEETSRDTVMGGKETTTTYTYYRDWASYAVDSSRFEEPQGHENPPMPIASKTKKASLVTLGAFQLPARLADKMSHFTNLAFGELPAQAPAPPGSKPLVLRGGVYTTEEAGAAPVVGDVRVTMRKVRCGDTTVLAVQNGTRLAPLTYTMHIHGGKVVCESSPLLGKQKTSDMLDAAATVTSVEPEDLLGCCAICNCVGACVEDNEEIFELLERRATLQEVLKRAQGNQVMMHWGLQLLGWALLFLGLWMMLDFVPTLFRVIPFLGVWIQLLGSFFAGIAAFLIATVLWCLVVALAWLSMRPMKALLLLVVAAALVVVPVLLVHK